MQKKIVSPRVSFFLDSESFLMSVMMEIKNDETKSCVFYRFLNMCSVD